MNQNSQSALRVTMISAFEDNADLMRQALETRKAPLSFLHLATRTDVDRFVGQPHGQTPPGFRHILLLDLDTAPDASWRCVEKSCAMGILPAGATIALVSSEGRPQTEERFGTSVSSYLPNPQTLEQARSLASLIDTF